MLTFMDLHGSRRFVIDDIVTVARHKGTARPTVTRLSECLCRLGPHRGSTWVDGTVVLAPHPDLHRGTVRRVHSTFISEFSVQSYKLQFVLKPRDSKTEMGKIPEDETRVSWIYWTFSSPGQYDRALFSVSFSSLFLLLTSRALTSALPYLPGHCSTPLLIPWLWLADVTFLILLRTKDSPTLFTSTLKI
jgi:hypothetical protein